MQKIFCHKYCFFVLFMKVTESLLVKKSVLGNYLFWRDTSCLIYFSLLSHFIYLFTYAFIHSLILHVCAWVHACHSTCMEIKKKLWNLPCEYSGVEFRMSCKRFELMSFLTNSCAISEYDNVYLKCFLWVCQIVASNIIGVYWLMLLKIICFFQWTIF